MIFSTGLASQAAMLMPPCLPVTNNVNAAICNGDSILLQGAFQLSAGVYTDTLFGAAVGGCDSIIITTLSINMLPMADAGADVTICSGTCAMIGAATVAGHSYAWMPGMGLSSTSVANPNACPTTSMGYTVHDTITATGCHSSDFVSITVTPPILNMMNASICQGQAIFLGGAWRTTSGVYNDTLSTMGGCDSILVTTLSLHPIYTTNVNANICSGDSMFLQGSYRTIAGTYMDNPMSMFACDSIVYTTLSVNPNYSHNDSLSICSGDSAFLGGSWQSSDGVYTDMFTSMYGCDSTVVSTLVVHSLPSVPAIVFAGGVLSMDSTFISYQWIRNDTIITGAMSFTFMPVKNGTYKVMVTDSFGCVATSNGLNVLLGISGVNAVSGIDIYPNPSTGTVFIEVNTLSGMDTRLEVSDLLGRINETKILKIKAGNNRVVTDLSHYDEGIYFISLRGEFGIRTGKIILKK